MPILDQLRQDIERELVKFSQHRQLSLARQQQLTEIRQILANTDPVLARHELIRYVQQLSTGLTSYLPFFEVNTLQTALRRVLALSCYQENHYLQTLLQERQISTPAMRDHQHDQAILQRLTRLEEASQGQTRQIHHLQKEIKRLQAENKYLMQALSALTKENQQLAQENHALKNDNQTLKQTVNVTQQRYDQLIKENLLLKEQLATQSAKHDTLNKEKLPKALAQPALPFKEEKEKESVSTQRLQRIQQETNTVKPQTEDKTNELRQLLSVFS